MTTESEKFVWVTWVGNKNSSYNNKTHRIPVGTPVQVYWDKDRFRKYWTVVIAEPKVKNKGKREASTPTTKCNDDGEFVRITVHVHIHVHLTY